VLDLSGERPVFYQLDGWHQYEHPYYWAKAIELEAENIDTQEELHLVTEANKEAEYDFSGFNTYVELIPGKPLQLSIPQKRSGELFLSVFVKASKGNPSIILKTNSGTVKKMIAPGSNELILSSADLKTLQLKQGQKLVLAAQDGNLLLDKLKF